MASPDLNTVHLAGSLDDISTASAVYHYITKDLEGELREVGGVLGGAIATADATITVSVNGTSVGTITVANSGSAENDVDTVDIVEQAVTEGDVVKVATDGASTNAVPWGYTLRIAR